MILQSILTTTHSHISLWKIGRMYFLILGVIGSTCRVIEQCQGECQGWGADSRSRPSALHSPSRTQWAAVTTQRSETSVPPQKCWFFLVFHRLTCHGWVPGSARRPPIILPRVENRGFPQSEERMARRLETLPIHWTTVPLYPTTPSHHPHLPPRSISFLRHWGSSEIGAPVGRCIWRHFCLSVSIIIYVISFGHDKVVGIQSVQCWRQFRSSALRRRWRHFRSSALWVVDVTSVSKYLLAAVFAFKKCELRDRKTPLNYVTLTPK